MGASAAGSWTLCRICGLRIDRDWHTGEEIVVQAKPC